MRYESPEFSEELKKRINADKEYREKARGMDWKTLIIVDDVPLALYSSYADGELIERKHLPSAEAEAKKEDVDFVVEIPTYDLWVEIANGRKPLESLFLGGMIKLEGSLFKALQFRDAIEKANKITAKLATESVIPSKEDFIKILRKQEPP